MMANNECYIRKLDNNNNNNNKTRGVSHCGLAIYIKKYLKAKRRILEIQILNHSKI
jgi:hypothetical protein